jgi:hypothetical protein
MNAKTRMTRQGLRDLNHYGPKRPTAAPVAPKAPEGEMIAPPPPVIPQVADAPQLADK